MSLAMAASGRLKPEIRLAKAVSQFEADLSSDQKATFRTHRSLALDRSPEPGDVMRLTAEVDRCASRSHTRVRCVGPRLTNILQAIQQYVGLGDILIGGSQNLIACGVWTVVRTSLLLITNHAAYLEKLSVLFMNAGRSAPRYQQMALLYPRSKTLRGNMCEYLIVVVQVCHRLLLFSKKSYIGQLASSLSDSDVQKYQTELETWAAAIKEEVNLLMGQRIEDEAKENSRFRAMTNIFSETAAHRKKVKERLRILDACSTFDYQTPWKQARKIGNTNLFAENSEYEEWRNGDSSRTFICTGKLGSGKSVLLANIIDDVNIYVEADKIPVAYFFCRHDIPESLQPRTVVGSLVRQLLSTMATIPEFSYAIVPDDHELGLDSMLTYFRQIFEPKVQCYFVLDGLDECTKSDQKTILDYCCQLQKDLKLALCVSFRLEADNRLQLGLNQFTSPVVWKIPDKNPEIAAFVDAELQARIVEDKLKIGEPTIVLEIREALLEGAQGMFLWVALQISSLCEEKTDQRIRDALRDLPRDLSKTFSRILDRAAVHDRVYQKRILQLVTVAYRPLKVEELREALSVIPGDTDWDPAKLVNDIYSILACCGSLITIDEEERTIRFVHHSVKQYLIGHFKDETPFNFDLEDANRLMGQTILTYLNYNVFDTQLSTTVIPEIHTGAAPSKIINSIDGSSRSKTLALRLLKSRMKSGPATSQPDFDIGQILASHSKRFHKQIAHDTFAFHPYAKDHWLIHTTSILESDAFSHRALIRLLKQFSDLPTTSWGRNSIEPPCFTVDISSDAQGLPVYDLKLQVSPVTYWALKNSHLPLLRHQLKTVGAVKTIASISLSLKNLLLSPDPPIWQKDMCNQLLSFAAIRGSVSLTRILLDHGATIAHNGYSAIAAAISGGNVHLLRLLIQGVDNAGDIKSLINGLDVDAVLVACRGGNAVLASFLVSIGADVNRFSGSKSPLYYILNSLSIGPEYPETAKELVKAGAWLCCPEEPFIAYTLIMNWLAIPGSSSLPDALVSHLGRDNLNRLLFDCCTSNLTSPSPKTTKVAAAALEFGASAEFYDKDVGRSCLSMAIQGSGPYSDSMVEVLLKHGASALTRHAPTPLNVLEHCLVNNKLTEVKILLLHGLDRTELRETISRLGLLHRRIKEADYAAVEFLCAFCGADMNSARLDPTFVKGIRGMTPLFTAINRENKKFDPAAIVLDIVLRGADLNDTGPYGNTLPLHAVIDRVTNGGDTFCFHQSSAAYLRLARCLVAFGAQFDESLIVRVVRLSLSLFLPGQAVELEGDSTFGRARPTNAENLRRKNLHQSPLEDSVLSLLEQVLEDLVGRAPPSIESKEIIASLLMETFEAHDRERVFLKEKFYQSNTGPSYLFISHVITIIEILIRPRGTTPLHSSTTTPPIITGNSDKERSETLQNVNLVRILAKYVLFWFDEGADSAKFQRSIDVSSYLLLKHGRRSQQLGIEQCTELPAEGWDKTILHGMIIAVAEGDVESVRAGCDILDARSKPPHRKMIEQAEESLQKLNSPPEDGAIYELAATDVPLRVIDMTPESGPVELPETSLESKLHQMMKNMERMKFEPPVRAQEDAKKKKSKWWRPDVLSRQTEPDLHVEE